MSGVDDRGSARITVLIVDDHALVAESFRVVLSGEPDIDVVAIAGTAAEAVAAATTHRPDVVLMDYVLPDGDGAAAAARVMAVLPDTKVVMLTGSDEPTALFAAFEAGCVGYFQKTSDLERLASAVRAAAAGELVVSPADLGLLFEHRRRERGEAATLTPREVEVLRLAAAGLSSRAVAERLGLSLHTVRTHLQNVLTKLGAHSRLEAVAVARKRGLLRNR